MKTNEIVSWVIPLENGYQGVCDDVHTTDEAVECTNLKLYKNSATPELKMSHATIAIEELTESPKPYCLFNYRGNGDEEISKGKTKMKDGDKSN